MPNSKRTKETSQILWLNAFPNSAELQFRVRKTSYNSVKLRTNVNTIDVLYKHILFERNRPNEMYYSYTLFVGLISRNILYNNVLEIDFHSFILPFFYALPSRFKMPVYHERHVFQEIFFFSFLISIILFIYLSIY